MDRKILNRRIQLSYRKLEQIEGQLSLDCINIDCLAVWKLLELIIPWFLSTDSTNYADCKCFISLATIGEMNVLSCSEITNFNLEFHEYENDTFSASIHLIFADKS